MRSGFAFQFRGNNVDWKKIFSTGLVLFLVVFSSLSQAQYDSLGDLRLTNYGTERMRITTPGLVGIGTTSPKGALDIFMTGTASALIVPRDTTGNRPAAGFQVNGMIRYNTTTNKFEAYENGSWTNLISSGSQWLTSGSDIYYSGGNVGIGTTAPAGTLETQTTSNLTPRGIFSTQINSGAQGAQIAYQKARGTPGTLTAVANADYVGFSSFSGYDGSSYIDAAGFGARANGAIAANSVPTDLFFYTSGGADDVDPYANGHVRMVVSSSGNVGIGTTSPQTAVHIERNGMTDLLLKDSSQGVNQKSYLIRNAFGNLYVGRTDDNFTSATYSLTVLNSGTVGIGTSNPGQPLDVYGNIQSQGSSGGGNPRFILRSGDANTSDRISDLYGTGSTAVWRFFKQAVGTDTTSVYMTIDSTGNVGIGTTSPSSMLQVSGGSIVADSGSTSAAYVNAGAGNVQVSSTTATTINICGVKDGGAYTLILTGIAAGSTVTVNGYSTYVNSSSCSGAITVDLGGGSTTFVTAGNTSIISFVYTTKTANGHTLYGSTASNFNVQ